MEFLNLAILTFCVIFKGFAFWIDFIATVSENTESQIREYIQKQKVK